MRRVGVLRATSAPADDRPPPALTLLGEASRAAAFSAGRSAVCGALLGSATERRRVWRWSALRSSCATWGALTFARSMPAAEADTGRLNSRDARTAWATLRQVAADGRAASERSASTGMIRSARQTSPTPRVRSSVLAPRTNHGTKERSLTTRKNFRQHRAVAARGHHTWAHGGRPT